MRFLIGSVFSALYLLTSFIMRGLAKSIQGKSKGPFDRILGFIFGAARGAIIASLFIVFFASTYTDENGQVKQAAPPHWISEATVYPHLNKIATALQNLPFAKAKKMKNDLIEHGKDSDILPDLPKDAGNSNTDEKPLNLIDGNANMTDLSPLDIAPNTLSMSPKIREECGVFGVYGAKKCGGLNPRLALHALQHRGQEACGIASF